MAEMLSKASMGPPQEMMSFVLVGGDAHVVGSRIPRQDIFRQVGADGDGLFILHGAHLMVGRGAFFALKLPKAQDNKPLT